MKVLIIDDEPHIREMMRLTLETAGYEVGEAADGEEGLTVFGGGSGYDVVLLDQKMPGIDGLETLRRLLARTPDARVVMVTAFASVELAVDAMRLGATNFLRKPMTPEALRGAVIGALAERPVRREHRTASTRRGEGSHRDAHDEWFQNRGGSSADGCGEGRVRVPRQAFCRRDRIDRHGLDRSRGGRTRRALEWSCPSTRRWHSGGYRPSDSWRDSYGVKAVCPRTGV